MDTPHTSLCVCVVCKLLNNLKTSKLLSKLMLINLAANCLLYKANDFSPSSLKEFEHDTVTLDECSRLGNSYRFINFSLKSAAAITAYSGNLLKSNLWEAEIGFQGWKNKAT